GGVNGG
ncbi:retroviral pseudoprotease-like protein, partial [Monkeypox virus]